MVVEAALGATFRVAPRPYAHVHGKDGMFILASGQRKAGEQPPEGLGVDSPPVQRGVEAAPAATVRRLEAQVNGGMDGVCGEDGIGEFEEGIGSAVKTLVERAAEAEESVVVRVHDALIMHPPTACRLLYQSMELKRKLRARANRRVADVSTANETAA
jgi:hypothetical protein